MRPDSESWDFDATADNRSAQVVQVESLGKWGSALLALGIAIAVVALVFAVMAYGNTQVANDRAWTAEREARIAQDKADRIEVGLGKKGININSDGH